MLNPQQSAALVKRFAALPPVKWQAAYERLSTDERMALTDSAAHTATKLARVSAYVSRRMSGGKHEDAVKNQNQSARKVRQALGYTYTDDQITF